MQRTIPGRRGGTLHPWAPGQSGCPEGRGHPKRRLAAALEEALDRRGGPKALADALLDIAMEPGNKAAVAAIKEAYERLEPAKADSVTTAEAQAMVGKIVGVIRAELDEADAERVVLAIRDALEGVRTVAAEIRETG